MEQEIDNMSNANLMKLAEIIVDNLADSKLENIPNNVAKASMTLAKRLNITQEEAMWLAVLIDLSCDGKISIQRLARFFNCRPVRIMSHWNIIMALIQRRFIRSLSRNEVGIPYTLIEALKENRPFVPMSWDNLTISQWLDRLHTLLERRLKDEITYSTLLDDIQYLKAHNPKLNLVKKLQKWKLSTVDEIILLVSLDRFVVRKNENVCAYDFFLIFEDSVDARSLEISIVNNDSDLIKKGIIEHGYMNGQADSRTWQLTLQTKRQLLAGLNIPFENTLHPNLVYVSTLKAKSLFFSPKLTEQIEQLKVILHPTRFSHIQQQLAAKNMRGGFTCIFYGSPGTGKTETVYQLARETGRDIMFVDIPQVRSKWVGDSEKNIKAVFGDYKEAVRTMDVAPILLFNEADAIFGKRIETCNSVDKMENSLQNIILQEMESLEGILIATTNLTENLDSAFERRFLYKIEFSKPTANESQYIWKSMLPDLSDADALQLAQDYNFSGGQIENVARKQIVNSVLLDDSALSIVNIKEACVAEQIRNKRTKHIGFI
ncbi:MAG: ATP-binding protein [Paludibacteraceae bacterium]|nr:ATP-binding protein [Paludibacteraceae bacterium]